MTISLCTSVHVNFFLFMLIFAANKFWHQTYEKVFYNDHKHIHISSYYLLLPITFGTKLRGKKFKCFPNFFNLGIVNSWKSKKKNRIKKF